MAQAPQHQPAKSNHDTPPVKTTKDAAPVVYATIAEEQRARSLEMEQMGVEAWMKQFDNSEPDEPPAKKS